MRTQALSCYGILKILMIIEKVLGHREEGGHQPIKRKKDNVIYIDYT